MASTSYWEDRYRSESAEEMLWHLDSLDPDFAHGIRALAPCTTLDLGAGVGSQAVELAKRGFGVTATDISPSAISLLQARAAAAGVSVSCVVDDILESALTEQFGLVIDRGCFHVLPPERRTVAVARLAALLSSGGKLLMKVFDDAEMIHQGPYKFSERLLRELFSQFFLIESIKKSAFGGRFQPPAKALFLSATRNGAILPE